jgi:hypothetical protein
MQTFASGCQWSKASRVGSVLLFVFSAGWLISARADDAPATRAARLSYLRGDVTVDRMDNTGGDPAQINMPVTEGARLTTGEDGEAEVEFEDGSVVRVAPNSSLGLATLTVDEAGNFHTTATVMFGLVYAELRAALKFSYLIDAGGEVISPAVNTTIRIKMDEPPAIISVLAGTVHVEHASSPEADGFKTDAHAGETLIGNASDSSRYLLSESVDDDPWDKWNQDRDQAAAAAAAARTTARDDFAGDQGYGWSDLDANGNWYNVPDQGPVWQPTVALSADFDPYGFGSWVFYPSTGYVWASGYGWGWTPFRCGGWSYWNDFGWGWSPHSRCGFSSGVSVINIVRPPLNYRLPTRPIHGPGLLHPIPVGRPPHVPGAGVHSQEPRLIAGVPVEPLRPIGNASTLRGHGVVGAALRSDFPVDHTSRQPVLGVVRGTAIAAPRSDVRPGEFRSAVPPAAANGAVQTTRPVRLPPPPPSQRSGSSGQVVQSEHPIPHYPVPASTPHPAPSHPPPPASHPTPGAPAPAAPKK